MTQEKIAQGFDALTTSMQALAQDMDVSITDALIEIIEDVHAGSIHHELGKPTDEVTQEISQAINTVDWSNIARGDLRKILQLAILKANRDDKLQANHQLTPDGLGYLLADFLLQTANLSNGDTILDLTVGSGNLLNTINDVLLMHDITINRVGIDNDDTQLALATAVDQLLNQGTTEFYQEDVIAVDNAPKAKAVIADLPVGYYPLVPSDSYTTRASDGRSLTHHLLIEKSLDFVTDDGWVYLIVPVNVLSGAHAKKILQFVTQKAQLKAFLQLPNDFFKDQRAAKAILVLRKTGVGPHSEVLMGQYPNLKDIDALKKFLQEIAAWVKLNKEQDRA
ncbi:MULTISPECIES: class I SAM-dependent methyltransferase [Leuconostoc]|uniref:Class I SAM-dependent methyltransferase n=1 Tax=Leuconostoc kimchii TaxID=136609 RepID=A0ABX5SI44_9LACO|nr:MULTISPECIES: class I SAM-dependent methyltransferase [Leuconostoc]AEJ31530.1 type I restriction-modification system methyltransferase subunit(putative) [Leuconostoc sp. C2]QBR47011.1 class I SAM-dependent methyltransferase [Leuconostoc kimchii]